MNEPIIENGETVPPKKTRARRAAASKPKLNIASKLVEAMKFVALAQKDMGTTYQTHCLINNGWLVAFDGLLTIGTKIEENLATCPHTTKLLSALQRCGETLSMTQLNEGTLVLKSGKFTAHIPCVSFNEMPQMYADEMLGQIESQLISDIAACNWLIQEGGQRLEYAGVWLLQNSLVATNGHVILEFWHGLNLPHSMIVPKLTMMALSKLSKKCIGIGFSPTSLTFHFEDESFLKTQLIDAMTIGYEQCFNFDGQQAIFPKEFGEVLKMIAPLTDDKKAFVVGNELTTSLEESKGASYELSAATLPDTFGFNVEYLINLLSYIDENVFMNTKRIKFQKGNVRGVVMLLNVND